MARTDALLNQILHNRLPESLIAPSSRPFAGLQELVYLVVRRVMDVLIASAILALSLPLLAAMAMAIKLTSPGPVFFKQVRAGRNGRPFFLYKLRTMVLGADDDKVLFANLNEMRNSPCFKMRRDPRVTPVGRLLRRTSMDELPQLINVLRGEMALVGPRPLPLDEVCADSYAERQRLAVLPGLTCLWQICGRAEIPYRQWVTLDLFYVENRSLALDLRILFKTIPAVLSGQGAY